MRYDADRGVAEDVLEAVELYTKAAEQGDASAQFNLGVMYDTGEGVAENNVEAVKWYQKSAEQGYADAQLNLGMKYATGESAWENYALAHMWINLARAQGVELARKEMEILVRKMTTEQIAEAQKMASEWQAQHPSVSN